MSTDVVVIGNFKKSHPPSDMIQVIQRVRHYVDHPEEFTDISFIKPAVRVFVTELNLPYRRLSEAATENKNKFDIVAVLHALHRISPADLTVSHVHDLSALGIFLEYHFRDVPYFVTHNVSEKDDELYRLTFFYEMKSGNAIKIEIGLKEMH